MPYRDGSPGIRKQMKRTLRDQIRVRLKAKDPVQSIYSLIYTERIKAVDNSHEIKITKKADIQKLNTIGNFRAVTTQKLIRLLRQERRQAIQVLLEKDEDNKSNDWRKINNAIGMCCYVPTRVRHSLVCLMRRERAKNRKKVRREIKGKYTIIKKVVRKEGPMRLLEI